MHNHEVEQAAVVVQRPFLALLGLLMGALWGCLVKLH